MLLAVGKSVANVERVNPAVTPAAVSDSWALVALLTQASPAARATAARERERWGRLYIKVFPSSDDKNARIHREKRTMFEQKDRDD
jgi:hypothetical protein